MDNNVRIAIFAAGCFWGVEEAFRKVPGVINVEAGYTGGDIPNPAYEDVGTGRTGHAEAVRVYYDPDETTYAKLLRAFWSMHDPTQHNRQGYDVGNQYRSAIFFQSDAEQILALQSRDGLTVSGKYKDMIVTEIVPAKEFYRAEEYHQQYLAKRQDIQ